MDKKKILDDVQIIADGIEDPAKIEALGRLKGALDGAENELNEATAKVSEITGKWRDAVIHGGYSSPEKKPNGETEKKAPKTFIEFLRAESQEN